MGLAFAYLPNVTLTAKTDYRKTHGDLISPLANLGAYNLILHGCRHCVALKFGRVALYNFRQRLPKFQAKSSKFIFYDWNEPRSFSQPGGHLTPDFHQICLAIDYLLNATKNSKNGLP